MSCQPLSRLTHLAKPTAERFMRIANMSYYLLDPNPQALQILKQCLHFDPDSKPCRIAHRNLKVLEKDFTKLDQLEHSSSWASLIRLLAGTQDSEGFAAKFDKELDEATSPLTLKLPQIIIPRKRSPRRLRIYSSICRAHVKSNQLAKGEKWCEEVLKIDDRNLDGLIARGETKLKAEEWEDAVRAFEAAFEASGRNDHEVF